MLKYRFQGGFLDGLEIGPQESDPLYRQAYEWIEMVTQGGELGRSYVSKSPAVFQDQRGSPPESGAKTTHKYTVVERRPDGEDEIAIMQYDQDG